MKTLTHKNSLRLIILMIYYFFSIPMHIRPIRRIAETGEFPIVLASVLPFIFFLFALIECFEFFKWHYEYSSRVIPRVLFFLRVLVLVSVFFVYPENSRIIVLFTFSPPIIFYAYFVFPMFWSISLIIINSVFKVLYDLFNTSFDTSSNQLIFMLLFSAVIDLLFFGLAWFFDRDQKQSEENQQLLEQLRDYASKVAHSVAMEERTRLARDIHDTIGHSLTAIQIQLSKAEAYMDKDLEEAANAVRAAKMTAKDAMFDVRTSVSTLNSDDDIVDFKNRVHKILHGIKGTGLNVQFDQKGADAGYNFSVLSTLIKIVQEGLTNILKHARADSAEIFISFGLNECNLILHDNGCGFILSELKDMRAVQNDHYGLKGLERRIELVRGTLHIESIPGSGTTIKASLPKDPVQLIGDNS